MLEGGCGRGVVAKGRSPLRPPRTRLEVQRLLQAGRGHGIKCTDAVLVKALHRSREGCLRPLFANIFVHECSCAERVQPLAVRPPTHHTHTHVHTEPAPSAAHGSQHTGMGMRLSWLTMEVETKTSAMDAPRERKPPAVPAAARNSPQSAC
jgi:hypothetical protein